MEEVIQISYIYYNKALEDIKNSKVSSAKKNLENAIKIYSNDMDILNLLGVCEYLLCNFNKAFNYWNRSEKINAKENNAIKYLSLLDTKDFKQIINIYNNAIEEIHKKNYKESIRLLEKVIDIDNNLIEPYYLIGVCYIQLDDYKKSIEYLKEANDKDKENNKYLELLNFIKDKKDICINKKYNFKFKSTTIALISIFTGICIFTINDNINSKAKYQEDINLINENYKKTLLKLDEEKTENEKLIKENSLINSYKSQVNQSLFNDSIKSYKEGLYKNALEGFEYLASESVNSSLKSESIYFTAVSYEKIGDYEMALKYYEKYIEGYYCENYYDDSLYNAGMMLFKNDDIKRSKEFLTKLKNELPNSIYYNSRVKSILEK